MKIINLTKGKTAIVDDEDFDFLAQWKWCTDSKGYAVRMEKRSETGRTHRKLIRMQREIMKAPAGKLVDHINGVVSDNRKSNLRVCSASENMRNRKTAYNCKSGYKGVYWRADKKKWACYIKINGKSRIFHMTDNLKEGAHIYNQWASQLFGEFARLNNV